MSFVNGSTSNNPFAYLQALWQQGTSASGAQAQSDPLSALLAELNQQGTPSAASGTGSASNATSPATGASSSIQFGPQTLQALLALQDNGPEQQSLSSQFANAINDADPSSTVQNQGQHHGHRHHQWSADGGTGVGNNKSQLTALAGATSQTTTNANGSTTTSITYANGSSVSMTNAAPGVSSTSDSSSSTAGGANVSGNNFIEQLIQMQAQLLTPSTTQSIMTA